MDSKGYCCLVAGALIAAFGARVAMCCQDSRSSLRQMRSRAARMTSCASHRAGRAICHMGDRLAEHIR